MELKKQKLVLITILTIVSISLAENTVAVNESAENQRGICDAWFSKEGEKWENTTAKTSLKLGQIFYIKVMVKGKIDLKFLRYQLTCYGPPYDFEVVERAKNLPGKCMILQESTGRTIINLAFEDVRAGEEYTHIWKIRVKPNSSFGGGNTPINLDAFFFNGDDEETVLFTAVSVTITDELWEGYSEKSQEVNSNYLNKNSHIQGFEIILVILAIGIISLLKKNKFF